MGKFKHRKIKTLVVIAERNVVKVGETVIHAPLGVEIDPRTGEVKTPVKVDLIGKPVFTPTIVDGKLINHGLQKACLIVTPRPCHPYGCETPIVKHLDIPIQSICEIPGLHPGDHIQEHATVEAIEIRGFADPCFHGWGKKFKLVIKVIYKVRVIITREEITCLPSKPVPKKDCYFNPYGHQWGDYGHGVIYNKNNINVVVTTDEPRRKKHRYS